MYQGIVFDLDHTLFDRYATLTKIAPYFCSYFDVSQDMTPEKFAPIWIEADKNFVCFGWEEVVAALDRAGVFRTVPDIEVYGKFLRNIFTRIAVPFDCTVTLPKMLREMGYKVGLVTNGNSDTQRSKIRLLSLEDAFDDILVTGEFGVHKPAPEPFLEEARRLNLSPSDLLYVGDNPLNDVEGSRNAGYTPVWVRTAGKWVFPDLKMPELQIDHVRELPELLKNLT